MDQSRASAGQSARHDRPQAVSTLSADCAIAVTEHRAHLDTLLPLVADAAAEADPIPGFALGVANRDRLRRAAELAARIADMPDGPAKTAATLQFAIDVHTCPVFCTEDHADPQNDAAAVHESKSLHTGPVSHWVHVSDERGATLAVEMGREPEYLDLGELDTLLANLALHRAMLAATTRWTQVPA